MENLMTIRLKIIEIYKRYDYIFNLILKFLGGIAVFMSMSSLSMGMMGGTKTMGLVFIGGIAAAVASANIFLVFSILCAVIFCLSASVEGALILFIVLAVLYLMCGRIVPEESILFIAMLVCFKYKVAYIIPIAGGIYFGKRAVFPVACAMFIYPLIPVFTQYCAMTPAAEFNIADFMDSAIVMYTYFAENLVPHISGAVFAAGIMVIVVLTAWGVSLLHIDYEKEIAVLSSAAVTIVGMIVAVIMGGSEFSIVGVLISVVISSILLLIFTFFDEAADYRKAERVTFQDKNYVYYVKAVPKMKAAGHRDGRSED